MLIKKYQIIQNFIPDLPQIPFRDGVGNYGGVCLHATATWDTTPENERKYETTNWEHAFVHTFTSSTEILQVSSFDYVSWGCSQTGNKFLINCELTQSHDENLFLEAYDRWVWLASCLLFKRKLGVKDKVTLWSHKGVNEVYHEGDHTDPIEYLASHNKTWNDVIQDVTNYYNQLEGEQKMLEQLQVQIQELQKEVGVLKAYSSMPAPDWAKEAVAAAVAKGLLKDPDGRSYDLYAILTILYRNKVI